MKEYHLGILLGIYEYRSSDWPKGVYGLTSISRHYSTFPSTILSFFLGYDHKKHILSSYLRAEEYSLQSAETLMPKEKVYYAPLSFEDPTLRGHVTSPWMSDAYFYVVDNNRVIESYRISNLLDSGELLFGDYLVTIDKDSFIKRNTGDYPYMRVNVSKAGTPLEFNVVERMFVNRFFERQIILYEDKLDEKGDFDSLFQPLSEIDSHVKSVNLESILQDLRIRVSFYTWRDNPEVVEEARTVSFPEDQLDPYLMEYLGLRYCIREQAFYNRINSWGIIKEPFDGNFRGGLTSSYNHFNYVNQDQMRFGDGEYTAEQVNYVRDALIKNYSPKVHRDYLLKHSPLFKRREAVNFYREYYYNQSLVGSEKAYFMDLITSTTFSELVKKRIGADNYNFKYQSFDDILNTLNARLAEISWLNLHINYDWPSF